MCLTPKKIVTPFNRIARCGGQPLYLEVPCGQCAECKTEKRHVWRFRTFYQCDSCITSNGFVLYDTLTYSNKYLPRLSHFLDLSDCNITDFSCFNHDHFKDFLKRLRRRLDYHHKGVKFKYFLTSEYGCDDRYTHRPHYHILFFVYPNEIGYIINPLTFSKLVSETWVYGRTDGIPYQPASYVRNNVFASALLGVYNTNVLRVCEYVAKYINKDSDFQKQIDMRIAKLSAVLDDQEQLKKLIRSISMFHRQSQGFGISFINNLSPHEYNYIYNHGSCRIFDESSVVLEIPLPTYYKRKLFYKSVKIDDKLYWLPTNRGLSYLRDSMLRNIKKTSSSLKAYYLNCDSESRLRIDNLLNGRSFDELAIYKLYYRYRTRDLTFLPQLLLDPFSPINDDEFNLYDHLTNIISSKFAVVSDDSFVRDKDSNKLTVNCINDLFSTDNIDYLSIIKRITYDQNSTPHFNHFDTILSIIKSNMLSINKCKQQAFDHTEYIKKRFKIIL